MSIIPVTNIERGMNMNIKGIIAETAVLTGLMVSLFAQGAVQCAGAREQVKGDVFRLHIIANSDSDEDVKLKLKVRDAILEASEDIFSGAVTAEQAERSAAAQLDKFRDTALRAVRENGFDYDIECEIADVYFDERTYGSVTLPEGEYTALRIKIGEAAGHNWWCVMFPQLCLPGVTDTEEVLQAAYDDGAITDEELKILSDPSDYEVRFYFAELFDKIYRYFKTGNMHIKRLSVNHDFW